MKQDVQVRTVNVIWSDVCGGRATTLAVGNGGLHPANTDLFPETKANYLKQIRMMER